MLNFWYNFTTKWSTCTNGAQTVAANSTNIKKGCLRVLLPVVCSVELNWNLGLGGHFLIRCTILNLVTVLICLFNLGLSLFLNVLKHFKVNIEKIYKKLKILEKTEHTWSCWRYACMNPSGVQQWQKYEKRLISIDQSNHRKCMLNLPT